MKLIYCLMLLLCPYLSIAQSKIKPLSVGDKLPAITCSQMVNSKSSTFHPSQFQGKLLILNFISTTCAACLNTLPAIDSLQKQFSSSMQLILVSSQPTAVIKRFLQNTPAGKALSLPLVPNDSVLRSFFPYEYISHLVWIGPDGTVKAITEGEYLTASNIRKALQQQTLGWPVKTDLPAPSLAAPFLQPNSQNIPASATPSNWYYSAFYKHMPGMPQGSWQFTDGATGNTKTLLINQSLPDIYRRLYNSSRQPLSHTILLLPQKDFFVYSDSFFRVGWDLYNTFCYETLQPPYLSPQQRRQQALDDINRYTQTRAYLTDTTIAGYVLKDTNTATLQLLYKRPATGSALSISGLLYTLNNRYGAAPVTDGRNNRQQAWLATNSETNLNDTAALSRLLLAHGLVLQPQPQKIQALVITQTATWPFIHSPKLYAK